MAQQYAAVKFTLQQGCGTYSNVMKGNGTEVRSCNVHTTAGMWQLQ